MCAPLSIAAASLAATAAGTAMNIAAQSKNRAAYNKALAAESHRQQEYTGEAMQTLDSRLKTATQPEQSKQLSDAIAARMAQYQPMAASVPTQVGVGTAGAPRVVVSDAGNRAAAASLFNRNQANARANMDAYTDLNLNNAIQNARSGQQIGMIGTFARGSSNILPLELQDAQHAGDSLSTLGNIFTTIGSVAGANTGSWNLNRRTPPQIRPNSPYFKG